MKNRFKANRYQYFVVASFVTIFLASCSCGGPAPVGADTSTHSPMVPPAVDSNAPHTKDTTMPKMDSSAEHRPEPRQTINKVLPKLDSTAAHRPEPRQTKK